MSALVVAVLNRKGGAGKTSLTKDLGFALSELRVRVLQVGLDPQSSLEVLAGLGSDTPPERTVSLDSRDMIGRGGGAADLA